MFSHDFEHYKNYWMGRGFDISTFVHREMMLPGFLSHLENIIPVNSSFHQDRNGSVFVGTGVRVDDFCFFSIGNEKSVIGSYIHIAPFCSLSVSHGFIIGDFSGLSTGVKIFTSSSDYSGEYMTHPPIPLQYRNPTVGSVIIGRHCIVGAGSVIMPSVEIPDGVAIGALSFVDRNLEPWGIYVGCPVRRVKDRKRTCLGREQEFLHRLGTQ
jgi:dTDP-4-amino-4,6-dideoxy-D-glucose acyltransferase